MRAFEEREKRRDAARVDNRDAILGRIRCEVGECGRGLFLSPLAALSLVVQHAHQLLDDESAVGRLE